MNTQSQEMTFFDRDGHYCVGGDFLPVSQNPCLIARTQAVYEDSLGPGVGVSSSLILDYQIEIAVAHGAREKLRAGRSGSVHGHYRLDLLQSLAQSRRMLPGFTLQVRMRQHSMQAMGNC